MTTGTSDVLLHTNLDLPKFQGKVRDVYDLGDRLLIVATDRVSAFDVVLPNGIPDKGRVLTQMSAYWFENTEGVVPNHMIRVIDSTDNPDIPVPLGPDFIGRTMLVRKTVPVKLEAIVRGYLSGSGWKDYQRSGKVCGIPLPAGLRESDALPEAIFTPSTKADEGHDENISYEQAVGIVGAEVANTVKVRSMSLYMYGLERARQQGFIIADTKFEFGMAPNDQGEDEAILIDEALTPDSSRFWMWRSTNRAKPSRRSTSSPCATGWNRPAGTRRRPPPPCLPRSLRCSRSAMRRASSALRGANCSAPRRADVPRYRAEIHVTLKRTVNDPQGLTIRGGLHSLGYAGVDAVRAGKYIEVWLDAPDEAAAASQVDAMCDQLLANPVIEDYRYDVSDDAV